jgi:hypothetical protein
LAVGAHLDETGNRAGGLAIGPARTSGLDPINPQSVFPTDADLVRFGIETGDIARLSVGGGPAQPEASALADGEGESTVMVAEDRAGLIDDVTGGMTEFVVEVAGRVAVGDETNIATVGLGRDRDAPGFSFGPHLLFGGITEREPGRPELVLGQDT